MGLDQYLYANKYTFSNDFKEPTWKKKNADFQKLKKAVGAELCKTHLDKTHGDGTIVVTLKVGYWRKANAVHQWFVDNCQNGEDDCRESYVSREKLEELLAICKDILAHETPSARAEELLPTQSGFFFGSTEYDEYYFQDLELTVKILENALSMPSEWDFGYQSSW